MSEVPSNNKGHVWTQRLQRAYYGTEVFHGYCSIGIWW